jgi:zinc/manganese transport system substrate-binding protein
VATGAAQGRRLNVPTAVAPLTDVVQNVGGPFIDLHGLIPGGMGSHTFEPVPPEVQHLTATDLIILNGPDRETPTEKLALAPQKPTARLLNLGNQTITAQD